MSSTPPPTMPPPDPEPHSVSPPSSDSPAMYESPSPPSTASSGHEYRPAASYGSMRRRRTGADSPLTDLSPSAATTAVVALSNDAALGSISPITRRPDPAASIPYSDMPQDGEDTAPHVSNVVWHDSSYVPVLPADETTALMRDAPLDNHSVSASELLSRSRADLERARLASTREYSRRELREGMKDRYILGCSVLVMTAIVFVIIVSGMTTILANRNYPQLEVFSDWPNGGLIPLKYGCHAPDGHPVSIPLRWRNVPRAATNLVVLFANPGAISKRRMDPVHWFITDIPLEDDKDGSIPANASLNPELMPPNSKQRANAGSSKGVYWPPCFTNGTSFFIVHIYAIEAPPVISDFRDAREIMNRFVGVPVARLTGWYGKPRRVLPGKGKKEPSHGTTSDKSERGAESSNVHGKGSDLSEEDIQSSDDRGKASGDSEEGTESSDAHGKATGGRE